MAARRWEHNFGHDMLTAEHNALVEAAEGLAKTLQQIDRLVVLPAQEHGIVQAALTAYRGTTSPHLPSRL
jgi:ABC-type phosphate transport system permease subunit